MPTKKAIYSEDAERQLLGCVLCWDNDEICEDIFSKTTAEDFADFKHRQIYTAMRLLWRKGKRADVVTIMEVLERMFPQKDCGAYLSELTEIGGLAISAANYSSYLGIVREYSALRSLQGIFEGALKQAGEMASSQKIVREVWERLNEHEELREGGKRVEHISSAAAKEAERIERIARGEYDEFGVETGFPILDKTLRGLQKSDLVIVGARAGVGKTAFALNVLDHSANVRKNKCLFFSLEMPKTHIARRLMSLMTNTPASELLSPAGEGYRRGKLADTLRALEEGGLYIDDTSNLTVPEMLSKAKRMQRKSGLDLIVVDYLQFVKPATKRNKRYEDVSEIARDLKGMARQLNVPVVALCQLNRALDTADRQPALSDLRESGEIENNADVILFLNPTEKGYKEGPRNIEVIIGKFRNGAQKAIRMVYEGNVYRFRERDKAASRAAPVRIEQTAIADFADVDGDLPF